MKTLFERSFLKDLKKKTDKTLKKRVELVIKDVKEAENKSAIKKLDKLEGHASAYKIRIGDYRIGIFVEDETVIFSRLLHRKEIYKRFP